jgi:predicted dehydrogenase
MIGIALIGAGRIARVHAKAIGAAGGRLTTVYDVVESAADAAGASLRLGRTIELKTNCEVTWHD